MSFISNEIFGVLHQARRIWAIAAIHGEAARLKRLHDQMAERYRRGDRIVYLGNYLGLGPDIPATIDEMLLFRRELLCMPGMEPGDIVFLRGAQEEIWRKLLQIQMASQPREVFRWMMAQGVEQTLRAYGGSPEDFEARARDGVMALTRWTQRMRDAVRAHAGHDELLASLRRAAYTADRQLLFVHAGVDPARPLGEQKDAFWWGSAAFADLAQPFESFRLVVSGYCRKEPRTGRGPYSATIDGGAGRGGNLAAACFDMDGQPVDWLEA